MSEEHPKISPLKWTLTDAAQQCSVSRSTIRRYRESGKFPHAEKQSGQWVIPVTDLITAGLKPGQPSPPDEQPNQADHTTKNEQPDHVQELSELRAQLQIEQAHRKAAEQIAAEREQSLIDLRRAMRIIEAPQPTQPHFAPGSESEPTQQEQPEPKQSWWKRLFN